MAAPLAGQSFDLHQLCAIGWNAVGAQDLLDPDIAGDPARSERNMNKTKKYITIDVHMFMQIC